MVFHRQLAIGLFDFIVGGILSHPQHFIVVTLRHVFPPAVVVVFKAKPLAKPFSKSIHAKTAEPMATHHSASAAILPIPRAHCSRCAARAYLSFTSLKSASTTSSS